MRLFKQNYKSIIAAFSIITIVSTILLAVIFRISANRIESTKISQNDISAKPEKESYADFKNKLDKDELETEHNTGQLIVKLYETTQNLAKQKIEKILGKSASESELKDLGNSTYLVTSQTYQEDESAKPQINTKLGKKLKKALQDLSSNSDVEYAVLNNASKETAPFAPTDPFYPNQWILKNIGQYAGASAGVDINMESAWDITQGNPSIIVADIDAGFDLSHVDMVNKYVAGYDFADNDNNVEPSTSYRNSTGYTVFHASAVSSIIAANNNDTGISGVCPKCKIMPLKVYSDNDIIVQNGFTTYTKWTDANLISAINYAKDNGAKIANLEVQGKALNTVTQSTINAAVASGMTIVAAAGNYSTDSITNAYPGAYDNVINVAALRGNNQKTGYTNYGSWIDVSVPVDNLTDNGGTYAAAYGNLYWPQTFHGTSAAAPYVAGLAALIYDKYPTQANAGFVDGILKLTSTNIDSANPGYEGKLGAGRINAYSALSVNNLNHLIWRNKASGEVANWNLKGGTTLINGDFLPSVLGQWDIRGTGDFNGDGNIDIVWRDYSSGANAVWYMKGPKIIGTALFTSVGGTDWDIKGVGDFNSDGKPDLVWRNKATGQNAVWYMNNATIASTALFTSIGGTDWDIKGAY